MSSINEREATERRGRNQMDKEHQHDDIAVHFHASGPRPALDSSSNLSPGNQGWKRAEGKWATSDDSAL